jgi:hypothetical protein
MVRPAGACRSLTKSRLLAPAPPLTTMLVAATSSRLPPLVAPMMMVLLPETAAGPTPAPAPPVIVSGPLVTRTPPGRPTRFTGTNWGGLFASPLISWMVQAPAAPPTTALPLSGK